MSEIDFQVGRQSDTSDLYDITCSATSECTPIPMLLLGTIGDRTVPLFGSNFECVIRYFEETGWSANCTGTMAKGVLESFGSILCRTSTTENVTTGEPQETSLTKQQFLCDDEGTCTVIYNSFKGELLDRTTVVGSGDIGAHKPVNHTRFVTSVILIDWPSQPATVVQSNTCWRLLC